MYERHSTRSEPGTGSATWEVNCGPAECWRAYRTRSAACAPSAGFCGAHRSQDWTCHDCMRRRVACEWSGWRNCTDAIGDHRQSLVCPAKLLGCHRVRRHLDQRGMRMCEPDHGVQLLQDVMAGALGFHVREGGWVGAGLYGSLQDSRMRPEDMVANYLRGAVAFASAVATTACGPLRAIGVSATSGANANYIRATNPRGA